MGKKILNYVIMYLAWCVSVCVLIYAIYRCWQAIIIGYAALGFNRWGQAAVSDFSIVILGGIGLVFIILIQNYYQIGMNKKELLKRFLLVTAIEAGVLALVFFIQVLAFV